VSGTYRAIEERLVRDEVVLLDGATGTELERRGVPMVEGAWCGLANFTHPEVVRQVHEDYVRLGCEVVIANTFASSRHMLEPAGYGERAAEGYRIAVRLAKEAVARASGGRPVAVAGSLATARPVPAGTDRAVEPPGLTPEREATNYREAAEALAAAGADLILLEMITDIERGERAFAAARATGLPVWVGLSARSGPEGRLASFRDPGTSFEDLVAHWAGRPVQALGVMHTSMPDADLALPILRRHWAGPLLVYPEQGWFEAPHWQFQELDPEALADAAGRWIGQGARIVGGCCGIGPGHIAALARRLGRLTPA
jgi:S-methylmethionine-dependent homocysteine/selenocysteine methylase